MDERFFFYFYFYRFFVVCINCNIFSYPCFLLSAVAFCFRLLIYLFCYLKKSFTFWTVIENVTSGKFFDPVNISSSFRWLLKREVADRESRDIKNNSDWLLLRYIKPLLVYLMSIFFWCTRWGVNSLFTGNGRSD